MLFDSWRYKILKLFFDRPLHNFQLREISREIGLALPSVRNHVISLVKERFVIKEHPGIYDSYKASTSETFRRHKKHDMILRIQESGLLEALDDVFAPSAVVLFGSASNGHDTEKSDIDLLIVAEERLFDASRFEKILKREVSLQFNPDPKKIEPGIMNNIINGVVLDGYLKVL